MAGCWIANVCYCNFVFGFFGWVGCWCLLITGCGSWIMVLVVFILIVLILCFFVFRFSLIGDLVGLIV